MEDNIEAKAILTGTWKKFPIISNIYQLPPPTTKHRVKFSTITPEKYSKEKTGVVFPKVSLTVGKLRLKDKKRAEDLGIKRRRIEQHSFENNQSFPQIFQKNKYDIIDFITPLKKRFCGMEKIRVDGSNGLRFSVRRKGCFTPGTGSPYSGSFAASAAASESLLRVPQTGINPNKAVFTIDSKTSQILIVNNNACELLGYRPKELCNMQFSALLSNKNKSHVSALAEGQLNSEDGTMVLLSGKVVEMNTKYNTKVAVSLWIRQIDVDGRCLAVAEPVERRIAQILIDRNGCILSGDYEALMLFQLESIEQFCGMDIQTLIPAINLPDSDSSLIAKHIRKQKATGKTSGDGISFPLCLMISQQDSNGTDTTDSGVSSNASHLYLITIWVFQNISGLLVINENGTIESCNHHFSMLMFGYSQTKILGLHITQLIPNFGQEFEYLGYSRSRNATTSSLDNDDDESVTETDPVYVDNEIYVLSTDQSQSISNTQSLPQQMDLAKAISEPVQICSDLKQNLASKNTNELTYNVQQESTGDNKEQSKCSIFKSISENVLLSNENSENNRNAANLNSLTAADVIAAGMKTTETNIFRDSPEEFALVAESSGGSGNNDIVSVCCDNELLTPVNEICAPLTNDIDVNIDIATTPIALQPTSQLQCDIIAHRSVDSPNRTSMNSSKECFSFIAATPKPNNKRNDPNNEQQQQQQLVTSTPGPDVRRYSTFLPGPSVQKSLTAATYNILSKNSDGGCCTGNQPNQYHDGKYKGEAIHSDENIIDILYTISSQTLPCGRKVFCVWICRDPDVDYDLDDDGIDGGKHQNLTLTFNSINSTIESSLGQAIKHTAAQNSSRPNSVSLMSQCEDDQINGEFNKYYTTLKQIGKGAYGYVKMAFRHTDRLLVITKFILKDKLTPQFMILTDDKRDIPMEIYLLTTVKHPNIVTVFDVFENDKFFQLVMEKHGSGMDLFEFIDRRPIMDEKLGCYIFRQIANAVEYLHSLNILHRDIKDENIIIDQTFHVKLIDFGSATFMENGKLFSTFYGTTEYCSPEVLAGNKYAGPELEMWSLGVTLYVLMFFENPFLDIEETLRASLAMPHPVSLGLETLLLSMLDKNPKTRCTMRQLTSNTWITQEINPATFNFSWIVPCEPHEANPEKYFSGQIYSSNTGLSTTSQQDSLSLADEEDSIIDVDEVGNDDDEDDDDNDKSFQSQDEYVCKNCVQPNVSVRNDPECYQPSTAIKNYITESDSSCTATVISHNLSSDIGKKTTTGIPINQLKDIQLSGNASINYSILKKPKQSRCLAISPNRIINNKLSTTNVLYNNCDCSECPITAKPISNSIVPKFKSNDFSCLTMAPIVCVNLPEQKDFCSPTKLIKQCDEIISLNNLQEENILCDTKLVSKMTILPFSKSTTDVRIISNENIVDISNNSNKIMEKQLSVDQNHHVENKLNIVERMVTLSKSETNIFDDDINGSKLSVFNVVSLNDLNDATNSFCNKPMNDLSKNQMLNNISDNEIGRHGFENGND